MKKCRMRMKKREEMKKCRMRMKKREEIKVIKG
jgi:hypothetical protein